jgi:hypothetical protein
VVSQQYAFVSNAASSTNFEYSWDNIYSYSPDIPGSITGPFIFSVGATDIQQSQYERYVGNIDTYVMADIQTLTVSAAVPGSLDMGHAASRLRWHWLHGLSPEGEAGEI